MPVRKYRSVADIPPNWMDPDDPRLPDKIRSLWDFTRRAAGGFPYVPGVQKFRTIEESNAARLAAEIAFIQERRAADPSANPAQTPQQ